VRGTFSSSIIYIYIYIFPKQHSAVGVLAVGVEVGCWHPRSVGLVAQRLCLVFTVLGDHDHQKPIVKSFQESVEGDRLGSRVSICSWNMRVGVFHSRSRVEGDSLGSGVSVCSWNRAARRSRKRSIEMIFLQKT
jgi:hypothetical protein